MVKEQGAAIVLMANQPPHYFDREAGVYEGCIEGV
jgi:hypothetical protein